MATLCGWHRCAERNIAGIWAYTSFSVGKQINGDGWAQIDLTMAGSEWVRHSRNQARLLKDFRGTAPKLATEVELAVEGNIVVRLSETSTARQQWRRLQIARPR